LFFLILKQKLEKLTKLCCESISVARVSYPALDNLFVYVKRLILLFSCARVFAISSDLSVQEFNIILISYGIVNVNKEQNLVLDNNKFKKIISIFSYDVLKNAHTRILKDAIPNNVDTNALIKEINQKFCQTFE
jgi:hypothetical protein